LKSSIERSVQIQKQYFSLAKDEIRETNFKLLKQISFLEVLVLALFIGITPLLFSGWQATGPYWFFFCCAVVIALINNGMSLMGKTPASGVVTALCLFFLVLSFAGCMAVDILPNPNMTSTFFQIVIAVFPVIFVFPITLILPVTAAVECSYLIILWSYKNPVFALTDSYSSVFGFLCAVILMVTVAHLRASEGISKYYYIRQGTVDSLTQVYSRAEFESRMRAYFEKRKAGDVPCAMLMLDLDDFKNINDQYGHQVGDFVLKALGDVLNEHVKDGDLAGRIGGDEFMMLIHEAGSEDDLTASVAAIVDAVAFYPGMPDGLIPRCSVGAALLSGTSTYEMMYKTADQAMYEAKESPERQMTITRL
jgi:diguanylate cyclase (GGDEF)-like protein